MTFNVLEFCRHNHVPMVFSSSREVYGDIHRYISAALGIVPEMEIRPPRTGEVTRYVANIGKAMAILGYQPTTALSQGIPMAVAWCRDWWANHPSA